MEINNFIIIPEKTLIYVGIEIDEKFSSNKQKEILAKNIGRKKQYFFKGKICLKK